MSVQVRGGLTWEFEGELEFVWAIGSAPVADPTSHRLNVSGRTGMLCDRRLWTGNPIGSTFPACTVRVLTGTIWEAANGE